jgi:hypothetical protein
MQIIQTGSKVCATLVGCGVKPHKEGREKKRKQTDRGESPLALAGSLCSFLKKAAAKTFAPPLFQYLEHKNKQVPRCAHLGGVWGETP